MRAGVGYRARPCDPREEKKKCPPSMAAPASRSQETRATDESASGVDNQVQPQSALKILQQQLESFQALRQQTLQNVQSEISEILNKNIIDMKNSELTPDNLCLTSTPINIAVPRRYQEASHFKKQLHFDNRPATSHCTETDFSTVFGNTIVDENILLKYKAIGKSENYAQTSRNKPILDLNNDHELKNSMNNISSPSFVSFKTDDRTHLRKNKSYDNAKVSMVLHKFDEEDECLTESVSFSFKDMQEESKKAPRYMLNIQNTPSVCCKDNDSGYLSEQDVTEKAINIPNEELKSKRISDMKDSVHESYTAMDSSKENNKSAGQTAYERKYNKEPLTKDSALDKLQLNFLSKAVVRDNLLFPEPTKDGQAEKQYQLLISDYELRNGAALKLCDVNSVLDDYGKKARLLQMLERESEHTQKMNLEQENIDLGNQLKPLTDIIQCLTEQNLRYKKQIKDLCDDKNNIQEKLVKSEGDCKECLKEVKRLLKKCKELQQQNATLEENQNQLYAQNQRIIEDINDFQEKDQKAQEDLAFFTKEKTDLTLALGTLEKQVSTFQEENKTLGEDIHQLADTKAFLENELGEKQKEIQRLKENEKTVASNLKSLFKKVQLLKDEKLNLEEKLQEALSTKEVLQKELVEAQSRRADAEDKLVNECKTAKREMGVLNSNLSNIERECVRLRTMVASITDDNWVLKKQLHEYKQEASEDKNKIRQLSEDLLLKENKIRSAENERDVLNFEAHRLQKNNANLRDQIIALFNEQYKQRFHSESLNGNDQPNNPTGICEEIPSYQHVSFIHNPSGLLNGSKENLCVPSAKQGPRKKKSQSVEKLLKSEGKWKKKNYFWRQATRSRCTVLFRLVAPHPS
ncbi:coiled-coil domain-containing protein 110 isoform X2 [Sceloporus undulatus]|uniref:coiled-coil domain-containing protein 110 isoform X2 n=1 Tax=Sceloporus undulatus TaxID=8520 RepID=UPI001C4DAF8A|nr:coiled-coil domain-containing protein 110 isoform X2 [Sceloporus undulatus]